MTSSINLDPEREHDLSPHQSLRWRRLRHAPVRAYLPACGHAWADELRQSRPHGTIAMAGGYVCAVLVNRLGWPFFAGLPLASTSRCCDWRGAGAAALSPPLHTRRPCSSRCCSGSALSSCRLPPSITSSGGRGSFINIPSVLEGQFDLFGVGIGRYRLMIIVICGLLTALLQLILGRTRFGSRLRAGGRSPRRDRPRHQRAAGVRVDVCVRMWARRFWRRAGRGNSGSTRIPAEVHDLLSDRGHRRRASTITGPFLASLLLGVADVAGKYYVPKIGPFVIYTLMT